MVDVAVALVNGLAGTWFYGNEGRACSSTIYYSILIESSLNTTIASCTRQPLSSELLIAVLGVSSIFNTNSQR